MSRTALRVCFPAPLSSVDASDLCRTVYRIALRGHTEVLQQLRTLGLAISGPNTKGLPPRNHASPPVDTTAMQVLLEADARPNDDSLYIAACNLNDKAIGLLIIYGH